MKSFLFFIFFYFVYSCGYCQITITAGATAAALANKLVGSGITILSPTLTCASISNGVFTGPSTLSFDSGILLTNGTATQAAGAASTNPSTNAGTGGDAELTTLCGNLTYDACVLEFDFIPKGDTVKFNYVFGSVEYGCCTCSEFNDVFGFFISGPGYSTPTNIALVPGTSIPVCVNSVNCSTGSLCTAMGIGSPFCSYYVNNASGTTIAYHGLTTTMTAIASVTPCDTFHLKLGVADASDHVLDSGVFLEAGSLSSSSTRVAPIGIDPEDTILGGQYAVRGCMPAKFIFTRPTAGTAPFTINYSIGGTAVNGYDYSTIPDSVVIASGSVADTLYIDPLTVAPAGPKTIILYILSSYSCGGSPIIIDSAEITIYDSLPGSTGVASICQGTLTTLSNTAIGGTWSSSNTTVAGVDLSTGVVTGAGVGSSAITYSFTPGCSTVSGVTINPTPGPITGPTLVCPGSIIMESDVLGGGIWSSSSGAVATISTSGMITGVTSGTTTIVYNVAGCTASETVGVVAGPSLITGTLSVCQYSTTHLSDAGGGTWTSSNLTVASVGSTGNVYGITSGTSTIGYFIGIGCGTSVVVTVNAAPMAISGGSAVCSGFAIHLSDATTGGTWSTSSATLASVGTSSGLVIGGAVSYVSTATITYTAPGPGCTTSFVVTVDPQPAAISGPTTFCEGTSATLFDAGGGSWSSSNTAIATVGTSGTAAGVAAGTATIIYTLVAGCYSSIPITVLVAPADITGPTSLCTAGMDTLSDATSGGIWTSSNTVVATIDAFAGTLTAGLGTGTPTISYLLTNGCAATTTVSVNVGPLPISGTLSLCDSSTTTLSDGVGSGTWSSSNTGIATVDPLYGIVYSVSAGTATIFYTYGSCSVTATVTVMASPRAIGGVSEVCVGLATLLSDASTGGTWSSSRGSVASIVGTSGILTGGVAGTATISYILPDGCSATAVVSVNGAAPAISGITHVCPGATTTLVDAGGGRWSSGNSAVATVGSTGIVSGVAPGTASIGYSIGAGCAISITVTVNPLPAAIGGTAILCAGATAIVSDGAGAWSSGNMTIATIGSTSGIVSGIAGGAASITYTATATGCTAIRIISVNPLPLVITGTLSVCSGATTGLGDLTTGGNWSSSATAIATVSSSGGVSGLAPGISVITYSNPATGCNRTAVVTVNPLPAIPSSAGTASICGGATATLTDATTGGLWSSSSGSIATVTTTSGIVRGVSAGTAVVSYILATGCARTTVVTINPLPATIVGPTAECVGATIMEDESLAGGYWNSSVTAVATVGSTGNVTGVATGSTVITYTSSAGCRATTTITVSLSPTGIIGGPTVCANDTATLSDAVGGGVWSSDNTAAARVGSLSGTVTGVTAGTTVITYSLGTGCTVRGIMTVSAGPDGITGITRVCAGATTVLADATAGGTWGSSATVIATVLATVTGTGGAAVVTGGTGGTDTITYTQGGCAVNTIVSVNLTPEAIAGAGSICAGDSTALSDGIAGGVWTSGNTGVATVDAGGYARGLSPGTATITYSLGAGCTATKIISVNPVSPVTGSMGVCLGTTTALSDAAAGGGWSSSMTTVASVNTIGIVTGALAGTSVITYTTMAGCSATAVVTVNLTPSAISGVLHVCAGVTTTLGNTAGGGVWTSSNSATGTVGATGIVTGIVPGTTVITYSLGSGCTVTATVSVAAGSAAITGTGNICAGATTLLGDATSGGVWSAVSAAVATVSVAGIVRGVTAGVANITYMPATGCAAITTITINPSPVPITGTPNVCAGLSVALGCATTGGLWSSSNTAVATADPVLGIISGAVPGTAVITYTLPAGCSTNTTAIINSAPAPIRGSMGICILSTTALTDLSGGGIWSSSNTGVAIVSGVPGGTGAVTGVGSGTSTISYTAGGCPATAVVTINSLPDAIGSTSICIGSTETLTDLPDGGTWSSSNASIASIDETAGIAIGISAGTATITYSLGAGCIVTAAVAVNALPGAITGVPQVCLGYTTTLIDAGGGGVWSSSNTAIATVSGTGAVGGVAGGPVTVSYSRSSTGCAATRLVTVVAVPAITGVSDMCAFSTVMAVSDSLAGGTWTSTSVTVSTAGVVTPYSAGGASLTYTIPLGCYTTASFTVHPLPGPVTGDFHFCVGPGTSLGDTTGGGIWSSSNTAIASINPAGIARGLSGGTATISYVLATGCMETETIIVDSLAAAGTITGLSVVCAGASIGLSDPAAGGTWSSSNTSAEVLGGIVSGVSAGADTIKYTVSNSCGSATAAKTIVVTPLPEGGTISGPASVCVGDSIVLSDAAPGGIWSSSAAVITGGIVHGTAAGTDTIRYSVTNSCGTAAAVKTITVNTVPDAGSVSLLDTLCTGFTYMLRDSIPGGTWSSSNSGSLSISVTGLISAVSAGVDTISYSLTNMCGTTSASAIIAVKGVGGQDTITGLAYVCEGGNDTLTGTPEGGMWGSSNSNVTITPTATGAIISGMLPGADTISYTMPGECSGAGGIYPITVLSVNQCDSNTGAHTPWKGEGMLQVWPNPNDGMFTLLLSSGVSEQIHISITNVVGEKVKEITTLTNKATGIKLKEASGIYFINASTSEGIYEVKIVVGE